MRFFLYLRLRCDDFYRFELALLLDVYKRQPYVDFNAEPGDTDTPLIFQPPSDLTSNGNEIWIAAKGKKDAWGGCTVFVSDNNTNYRKVGTITNNARLGTLAKNMLVSDTTCRCV